MTLMHNAFTNIKSKSFINRFHSSDCHFKLSILGIKLSILGIALHISQLRAFYKRCLIRQTEDSGREHFEHEN